MSAAAIIVRQNVPPLVVTSGTYSDLVAQMDDANTAGYTEVTGFLYAGGVIANGNLIATRRRKGALHVSLGEDRLDRVTDSQYGTVASGSGTTRDVDSGHNLPASATRARIWRPSTGAYLAYDGAIAVSGDTVTFASDPGSNAADVIIVFDRCEFGDFGAIGSGEILTSSANLTPIWNSGLFLSFGQTAAYMLTTAIGANAGGIPDLFLHGRVFDTATMTGETGSYLIAAPATATKAAGQGIRNLSSVWKRCTSQGTHASQTIYSASNCGDPDTVVDWVSGIVTRRESTTLVGYQAHTDSRNAVTAGSGGAGINAGAASSFNQATSGPFTGTFFGGLAATSGAMEMTIREIQQVEINLQ